MYIVRKIQTPEEGHLEILRDRDKDNFCETYNVPPDMELDAPDPSLLLICTAEQQKNKCYMIIVIQSSYVCGEGSFN